MESSDAELSSAPSDLDEQTNGTDTAINARTTKTASQRSGASRKSSSQSRKRKVVDVEEEPLEKRTKRARSTKKKGAESATLETEEIEQVVTETPRKRGRVRRETKEVKVKAEADTNLTEEVDGETEGEVKTAPKRAQKPTKAKVKTEIDKEEFKEEQEGAEVKVTKKKRKTKEEKEAEAMPLAARTLGHRMFVGAHVSAAGGVQNAVTNANHIGGNAFALFLKSQRKWENPALKDEHLDGFYSHCKHHAYDQKRHVLPHGSYLVNLAHADHERATQAYGSFIDDLKRCEKLGIKLYNFHPGNTNGNPRPEAIARLAEHINNAHKATTSVIPVLETMATGGNTIGSTFEDLRDTIALVDNKSRVGVCIDTAHVFAAGYDIRTPKVFQETLSEFDNVVGMKYLKALHLNDSKAPFDSRRDLHFNIGLGFLGLRTFHSIMNEPRFHGLPLVLETPITKLDKDGNEVRDEKKKEIEDKNIWAQEIKLLESLEGMDVESEKFKALDAKLQRKGAKERARVQDQVDRRGGKKGKKTRRGKGKGKKVKDNDDSSLSGPGSE
ncbi:MAG: hypothetical protein M1820_008287 [Bogoriella megaspora]|nr:MAG: hypothetical protein M1820_008287 [Bogoriella megaspora]